MLQRVADEIADDPLEPPGIAGDHDLVGVEAHALLPAARTDGCRHQRAEVDRVGLHALASGVEARDLHQILDEPPQASDVGDEQLGRTASILGHRVEMRGQ